MQALILARSGGGRFGQYARQADPVRLARHSCGPARLSIAWLPSIRVHQATRGASSRRLIWVRRRARASGWRDHGIEVREALDRKEIEVKAAEIAQELGWQVTEQLDYGVTISDGDQRIVIRDSGHRDNHLLITAPDDVRPEGYGSLISGITGGEAQDSAAIAREIERRFF